MQRQMLIVKLDGDLYGIDVRLIQEVIKATQWREIPDAPNFIAGMISLRNSIIPLIKIKRFLDVPMFDLYCNKKVIILNFGEDVRIGVMVDDVVGIHYYDEKEIRPVETFSRSSILEYIVGMVPKDKDKVAILDIFSMFFNNRGDFIYKNYLKQGSKEPLKIAKKDFNFLKSQMEKTPFPFNHFTQQEITQFIVKTAALQGISIEELVKHPKTFQLPHFDLEQKRQLFFENKPDFYAISEIFESLIKKKDHIKVWVLGNPTGEDAYSLSMLFHAFDFREQTIEIIHSHHNYDALKKAQEGVFPAKHLEAIPSELWPLFFVKEGEDMALNPEIKKNIIFDFYQPNQRYQPKDIDLIYAPNYLSAYSKEKEKVLKNMYRSLINKGILMLGLFENIEGFANTLKKYYIKNRLVFIKGVSE